MKPRPVSSMLQYIAEVSKSTGKPVSEVELSGGNHHRRMAVVVEKEGREDEAHIQNRDLDRNEELWLE